VQLAEVVSKTLPISVDMLVQNLSAAYQVEGEPVTSPSSVVLRGPQPLVEQVDSVVATLLVDNPKAPVQAKRPLQLLDAQGNVVAGVTLDTKEAQIDLLVSQKQNARDVGVRAITSGAPPDGYWLSGLSTTPSNITVQGDTAVLDQTGTFIDTLPIDISQATGQLKIEVPLNIPDGLEVMDANGQPVRSVTVDVQVYARSSDLAITRTVEILNPPIGITATVSPEMVSLLLSGPLPTLQAIEANPDFVRIFIEGADLEAEQKYDLIPEIIVPDGLRVQLAPASVTVSTLSSTPETTP
jgi:YbbR domain-containing protein